MAAKSAGKQHQSPSNFSTSNIPGESKKVTRLTGYGISVCGRYSKLSVYQSKANLHDNILFGKVAHHFVSQSRPEIRKMLERGMLEMIIPHSIQVHD